MKSWKVLFIAGAVLLLTTISLTNAFPKYKRVRPLLKLYDDDEDLEGKEKPKIKVKCAKELSVIKKVGSRCSNVACPAKAKLCLSHFEGEAEKFCTCSPHSIYLKKEKVCVDLNKPCEQAKLLRICHSKATCKAAGKGLYYCKCKTGYTGDGETCQKGRKKGGSVKVTQNEEEEEEEEVEEKSSGVNVAVIAPAVGVPVLLIVAVVVYCVCKKKEDEDDEEEGEDY